MAKFLWYSLFLTSRSSIQAFILGTKQNEGLKKKRSLFPWVSIDVSNKLVTFIPCPLYENYSNCSHLSFSVPQQPCGIGNIIVPILQMRKLRQGEMS